MVGVGGRGPDGLYDTSAKAVVLGPGGLEANPEWRARYLGLGGDLCGVRGPRQNTEGVT